jgi:Zn-dependent peptidase ImmA (M78 family)
VTDADKVLDYEATVFAIELLMPFDWIAKDLEGCAIDVEGSPKIKELAKKYQVSEQLMTIRVFDVLAELNRLKPRYSKRRNKSQNG